jgi:hypothetical protein
MLGGLDQSGQLVVGQASPGVSSVFLDVVPAHSSYRVLAHAFLLDAPEYERAECGAVMVRRLVGLAGSAECCQGGLNPLSRQVGKPRRVEHAGQCCRGTLQFVGLAARLQVGQPGAARQRDQLAGAVQVLIGVPGGLPLIEHVTMPVGQMIADWGDVVVTQGQLGAADQAGTDTMGFPLDLCLGLLGDTLVGASLLFVPNTVGVIPANEVARATLSDGCHVSSSFASVC